MVFSAKGWGKHKLSDQSAMPQFLVLLPCVTLENGEMVMERIIRRFHHDYPRSTAIVHYSVQPIEPKA